MHDTFVIVIFSMKKESKMESVTIKLVFWAALILNRKNNACTRATLQDLFF